MPQTDAGAIGPLTIIPYQHEDGRLVLLPACALAKSADSLRILQDWLGSVSIKFYESKINLNWKPILKNIIEDPDAFFDNGGWSFLDQEGGSDEEDAEEEDEADPEFQVPTCSSPSHSPRLVWTPV